MGSWGLQGFRILGVFRVLGRRKGVRVLGVGT